MVAIPAPKATNVSRIYEALEQAQDPWMGKRVSPSSITNECSRAVWYHFRWCWDELPRPEGKMLRLFRRGNTAEDEIVSDLRAAGFEVVDKTPDGYQFSFFDLGGHMRGALDGYIRGVVEAPGKPHVLELKTFNQKRFDQFVKLGVEQSDPKYFGQVQLYMEWSGLERTLVVGENKNTSALHTERVRKTGLGKQLIDKARRVVEAPEPLDKLSNDPDYFGCRFCDFSRVCHEGALPKPTCRTCVHSTPVGLDTDSWSGKWRCEKWNADIPKGKGEDGCPAHVYIPQLTPWTQVDANPIENWVQYAHPDEGNPFRNGSEESGAIDSFSLYDEQRAGRLDALISGFWSRVEEIRERFNGVVVE